MKKQGKGQILACSHSRLAAASHELLKMLLSELSGSLLMECSNRFGLVNIYWVRLCARCWEYRDERTGPVLEPLKNARVHARVCMCLWGTRGRARKETPDVYGMQQGNTGYLKLIQIMKALLFLVQSTLIILFTKSQTSSMYSTVLNLSGCCFCYLKQAPAFPSVKWVQSYLSHGSPWEFNSISHAEAPITVSGPLGCQSSFP